MNEEIIYQKGNPDSGEIFVLKRKSVNSIKRLVGRFLMIGGLVTILFLISPFVLMEIRWRLGRMGNQRITIEKESKFAKIIQISDLKILKPADPEFSVVIPKIGVNSLVFADIPIQDSKDYDSLLKKGLVHAKGSFLPGENGSIFIFGHSTDFIWNISQFKALFYLLKELKPDDQVNLFYQGQRYVYHVVDKKFVDAGDLYYLKPKKEKEELILQTCWPPGTTWKRLLIFAEPNYKIVNQSNIL